MSKHKRFRNVIQKLGYILLQNKDCANNFND